MPALGSDPDKRFGAGDGSNGYILIVDPDDYAREMISVILEACGHFVQTVADGLTAMDSLKSGRCDVLISEMTVPMRSGFELFEFAQSLQPSAQTQFYLLANSIKDEDICRAKALNVIRIFCKPFSPLDLALSVGSFVGITSEQPLLSI